MNTKTLIEIIENLSDPAQAGKIDETLQEELRNTELSFIDRAIINAYLLQQDGKIAEAIEKWRSLANITEGLDNELASHAWLSVGSLLSEGDQKKKHFPLTTKHYISSRILLLFTTIVGLRRHCWSNMRMPSLTTMRRYA